MFQNNPSFFQKRNQKERAALAALIVDAYGQFDQIAQQVLRAPLVRIV
jgi:hypothetical protein